MKYLIVGLGNIGEEYRDTRHNVGFAVVEELARAAGATFSTDSHAQVARIKHRGRTLVLVKPSTYMNLSGKAVRYWLQKENLEREHLLVILDDLNLPFGKLRMRAKGSDGGHNGLKSIDQLLGSQDYPRLRVGIGNEFPTGRQVNYVLGAWSEEERKGLSEVLERAAEGVRQFATIGLARAMNTVNT